MAALPLFRFFVKGMLVASLAELLELKLAFFFLAFRVGVVAFLAYAAGEYRYHSLVGHFNYPLFSDCSLKTFLLIV